MIWELKIRECIVGTKQQKGIDFPESYWATVEPTTVRLQLSITSALRYTAAIIDVKNAFQTSVVTEEYREFVTTPPTYTEWLEKTEGIVIDNPSKAKLIRQMLNGCQGTKSASNVFGKNLCKSLKRYGFKRCITDHGFYVFQFDDGTYLYLSCSTDDLLVSFATYNHFQNFVDFLREYFTLTVQTGPVLKFIQMRIIQSEQGISLDQAEYVYEAVHDYFNDDNLEKIKTVSTPLRSDNEYERELYDIPLMNDSEFEQACVKHRGTFRHHTGKLLYAGVMTRFDIAFAVQRMAEFNVRPNAPAWEGIHRIMRYLAGDVLRPLFFPAKDLDGTSRLIATLTPSKEDSLDISNSVNLFTDAEYARCISTRHTYICSVITLLGVAIHHKVKKCNTIFTNTTDAEVKAAYDGTKRLKPIVSILEQMGFRLSKPTPIHIDNAATVAIIAAERMTPRCRHLDIPIAFLHQSKENDEIVEKQVSTHMQLADIGTKQTVPVVFKRAKYWLCGHHFYPREGTNHYDWLGMQHYEKGYIHIRDSTDLPNA